MAGIDEILRLTERVEACIEDGDWVAAGEANARRYQLLEAFFADVPGGDLDPGTRAALTDVLARNRDTVARLQRERGAVEADQQRLNAGRNAVLAYRRNDGLKA